VNPVDPSASASNNQAFDAGSRRGIELPQPPGLDRPGDYWRCQTGHVGPEGCGGPGRAGRCPLATACRPRRTWNGRRVLATKLGLIAMLASILPTLWLLTHPSVVRPGNLTTAHAQILSNKTAADACATCHEQAGTFAQWFGAVGAPHAGVRQTDRCLDCHHETIPKSTARWAHNLPPQKRTDIRLASAAATASLQTGQDAWVDSDDVQCNACHREHHGPDHSLTSMNNQQCQTCHEQSFDRFADGHPEFGDYPYDQSPSVSFDHRTHALKHYPGSAQSSKRLEFDCRQCHQPMATGELSRSVSFEVGCQECHDKPLRTQIAEGITLFQLPIISRQEADSIGGWPEIAIGSPESVTVPMQSMLSSVSSTLSNSSLSNSPTSSPWSAAITREFALALASQGQSAAVDQMTANGVDRELATKVFAALSPQVISDATSRWFGGIEVRPVQHSEDLLAGDSLLASDSLLAEDDLLAEDSLLADDESDDLLFDISQPQSDPLLMNQPELLSGGGSVAPPSIPKKQSSERFEPAKMIPGGGWYRDDLTLAIRYRGGSHDDPTLRAIIESMHQVKTQTSTHDLAQTLAIKSCLECHVGMDPTVVQRPMGWIEKNRTLRPDRSTKFSHVPHLNIASIADCKSCHAISRDESGPTVTQVSSHGDSHTGETKAREFMPLGKAGCATCHQSHAAGDQCTTCHRYHLPSPITDWLPNADF
jgi:hypothetical protein